MNFTETPPFKRQIPALMSIAPPRLRIRCGDRDSNPVPSHGILSIVICIQRFTTGPQRVLRLLGTICVLNNPTELKDYDYEAYEAV